jgi:hypothetical protein
MPDLVKFMLKHAAIGAIAAVVFVGLILWFDIMHIRHLVTHSPGGYLALVVLTALFTITFSSVQMGVAIMALGEEEDEDQDGGGTGSGVLAQEPIAIPIPVEPTSRR